MEVVFLSSRSGCHGPYYVDRGRCGRDRGDVEQVRTSMAGGLKNIDGKVYVDVKTLGSSFGTIARIFDDGRLSVQLDDGSFEIVEHCLFDALKSREGLLVALVELQVGGGEPYWVVIGAEDHK